MEIITLRNQAFRLFAAAVFIAMFSIPAYGKSTQVIKEGEKLFKLNCQNCHSTGSSGGCLGPILQGERSRRSREFIEARISNDKAKVSEFAKLYGHAELMPHLRVSPEQAKKLTEYIYSLESPKGGYLVKGHSKVGIPSKTVVIKASEEDISAGKKLLYDKGCLMCHSLGNMGGQFAPSFDKIGMRRDLNQIMENISNAELLEGNSGKEYGARGLVMPSSSLSADEIGRIASFLNSLK